MHMLPEPRPDPHADSHIDPHAAMEARFHAALWAPSTPEGLAGGPPDALARRFLVYRNNVQHGLCRALGQRFPVVERLVGAEFFTAMARVFAAAHPPATPVLIDWGTAFPAFLEAFPPVAQLPYLADVARLELACGRAYHAADAPVADPAALMQGDPAALRLVLAPSVSAHASRHSSVTIWANNQPGAAATPIPRGPEYALIGRARNFDTRVLPLPEAQYLVLLALLRGAPLAEAAAETDPAPLLALLLQHDLIAAIHGDTP